LLGLALGLFLLTTGCTSPLSPPSALVMRSSPITAPPPGKSLIQIHRPRAGQGYKLYTGVYDSRSMVADLGNGHSVAYVCEPGTHYIINRSVERVGVVEARVSSDKTYHLWIDTAGAFIASFQIEPIQKKNPLAKKIPAWSADHIWVVRGPGAARHEESARPEIELILRDFVGGQKADRLRHLSPDDSF
jgi:hypothetical protein